jgi:signal peptidase I
MKYTWKSLRRDVCFCFGVLLVALLLAIIVRLFVFSSFKIPTASMEPAILAGDYILVNKLAYGARIPKNLKFMEGGKFETFRVKGFTHVKRNDIIVFNFPYTRRNHLGWDLNLYYVKRCVAIPGDTFYIDNGIYRVKNCPDTLGNYRKQLKFSQRSNEKIKPVIFRCFPFDKEFGWNVKHFGPLYVPRAGDEIAIDRHNIKLYRNLIRYETDKPVRLANDTVYLGKEIIHSYRFRQNYYFMSGDHVTDSKDSRYWGLLPEDHIVGKAAIIWKSENMKTGKQRWKRILKTINGGGN